MKTVGKATDLITFSRSSGGTALRKISYGPDTAPLLSAYVITGSGTWAASGSDYVFEDTVGSQVRPGVSWPTNGLSAGIYLVEINIASITGATQVRVDGIGAADQLIGAGESSLVVQVTSKSTPRIRIEDTSTNIGDGFALTSFSVKPVLFDQADGDLVVFNHPADIPRIEYAADGSVKGLLVEEARTNLHQGESGLTYAVLLTKTANAAVAPDGTETASLRVPDPTSGVHRVGMSLAYSSGASNETYSAYLKAAGYDKVSLLLANQSGGYTASFDLSAGTITNTGSGTLDATIVDVGGGWYRCSMTYTATKTNPYPSVEVLDSENNATFTGDGTSGVYMWGHQIEVADFPTSYIPTSGATATRSADVASIATSAFGYRETEGTLFASYYAFSGQGNTVRIASLNDVSASNSIQMALLDAGTTYHEVRSGGAAVVTTVLAGAITDNALTKTAVASSLDDHAGATNGGTVGTDTIGAMPIGVTTLNIGAHYSGNFPFNGHLRSLKYYPRRLTNAQLQELST